MGKHEVYLYRSETWMDDNFDDIQIALEDTIKVIGATEKIINIETKERNGLNRFWIYTVNIK